MYDRLNFLRRISREWPEAQKPTVRQVVGLMVLSLATAPLHLRELATLVGCQKPAATRLTIELQRAGFVTKTRRMSDGREVAIAITAAGRAVLVPDRVLGPAASLSR